VNGEAVVMMVVAMVVIWGGLVLALVNLRRNPEPPAQDAVHRDL
jgi:Putative methionine and alanine importer, small subunit